LKVNISIFQENVEATAKLQPTVFSQVGHPQKYAFTL